MAQNRDAPAFQEYAATLLAKADFRSMSAEAKGVCWQMRLECWVNKTVPADPARLSRYLGEEKALIERVLPELMPFFSSDGDRIRSPELDDYRAHIEGIKEKQSAGGKKSAAKRLENSGSPKTKASKGFAADRSDFKDTSKHPASNFQVLSSVQSSPNQSNPTQPVERISPGLEWLNDYDRASNGS